MAYTSAHPIPAKPSRSLPHPLLKFIFFAISLLLIHLFPSAAPDVFSQSILSKFWELLHLLFIGIAVSYGLFSRPSGDVSVNDSEPLVSGHNDGLFVFEERCENLSGSVKKLRFDGVPEHGCESISGPVKKLSSNENSGYCLKTESLGDSSFGEGGRHGWLSYENVIQNLGGYVQSSKFQSWNSQYFPGESLVVVPEANYDSKDFGKPLGLPVRSLKQGIRNSDYTQLYIAADSNVGMNKNSQMGPLNVEKLNECEGNRSDIGYRSLGLPVRRLKDTTNSECNSQSSESDSSSRCSSFGSECSKNVIFGDVAPVELQEAFSANCSELSLGSRCSFSGSAERENVKFGEVDSVNLEHNCNIKSTEYCSNSRVPSFDCEKGKNFESGEPGPVVWREKFSVNSSESGSSTRRSSLGSENSKNAEFSGSGFETLEEDFSKTDTTPSSSPLPWRSRSGRWKLRGEERDSTLPPSRIRPLSVDETQFESLKFLSPWSVVSHSSQSSSISYPPSKHSRSFSSIVSGPQRKEPTRMGRSYRYFHSPSSPEPMNDEETAKEKSLGSFPLALSSPPKPSRMNRSFRSSHSPSSPEPVNDEELEKEKSFQRFPKASSSPLKPTRMNRSFGCSRSPSSQESVNDEELEKKIVPKASSSPPKPPTDKPPLAAKTKYRRNQAFPDGEVHKSLEDNLSDGCKSSRESSSCKIQSLNYSSSSKAAPLSKPLLTRGKSVRTRRSGAFLDEESNAGELFEVRLDDDDVQAVKNRSNSKESDKLCRIARPQFSIDHNKTKKEVVEKCAVEPEEFDMGSEPKNVQLSPRYKARASTVCGAEEEDYSSEVDKKAGEFIAKFREQIRLQKMSSIGDSGELPLGGNYF